MLQEYKEKKEIAEACTYDSYNDFVAAKVEEMSDMVIALLQYEDAAYALEVAQYSWIYEYFAKKEKEIKYT